MVKDNQFKPNIPKTYEQFILEEPNLDQQDLYPELGHKDISEQRGYGPSGIDPGYGSYNQESNYPCCRGLRLGLAWQDPDGNQTPGLIIRLTGGTF
jgi:hypothetical protein